MTSTHGPAREANTSAADSHHRSRAALLNYFQEYADTVLSRPNDVTSGSVAESMQPMPPWQTRSETAPVHSASLELPHLSSLPSSDPTDATLQSLRSRIDCLWEELHTPARERTSLCDALRALVPLPASSGQDFAGERIPYAAQEERAFLEVELEGLLHQRKLTVAALRAVSAREEALQRFREAATAASAPPSSFKPALRTRGDGAGGGRGGSPVRSKPQKTASLKSLRPSSAPQGRRSGHQVHEPADQPQPEPILISPGSPGGLRTNLASPKSSHKTAKKSPEAGSGGRRKPEVAPHAGAAKALVAATVEVVERVCAWRVAQTAYATTMPSLPGMAFPRPRPFPWRGECYLVRLCSDVDELANGHATRVGARKLLVGSAYSVAPLNDSALGVLLPKRLTHTPGRLPSQIELEAALAASASERALRRLGSGAFSATAPARTPAKAKEASTSAEFAPVRQALRGADREWAAAQLLSFERQTQAGVTKAIRAALDEQAAAAKAAAEEAAAAEAAAAIAAAEEAAAAEAAVVAAKAAAAEAAAAAKANADAIAATASKAREQAQAGLVRTKGTAGAVMPVPQRFWQFAGALRSLDTMSAQRKDRLIQHMAYEARQMDEEPYDLAKSPTATVKVPSRPIYDPRTGKRLRRVPECMWQFGPALSELGDLNKPKKLALLDHMSHEARCIKDPNHDRFVCAYCFEKHRVEEADKKAKLAEEASPSPASKARNKVSTKWSLAQAWAVKEATARHQACLEANRRGIYSAAVKEALVIEAIAEARAKAKAESMQAEADAKERAASVARNMVHQEWENQGIISPKSMVSGEAFEPQKVEITVELSSAEAEMAHAMMDHEPETPELEVTDTDAAAQNAKAIIPDDVPSEHHAHFEPHQPKSPPLLTSTTEDTGRAAKEQEERAVIWDQHTAATTLQATARRSSAKAKANRRREEKLRVEQERQRMEQDIAATTLQGAARGSLARSELVKKRAEVTPELTDDGIYVPWLRNADSSGVHVPDVKSHRDSANADALDDVSEDLDPEEAWEAEADELVEARSTNTENTIYVGVEPPSLGDLPELAIPANIQESSPSPKSKHGTARGLTSGSEEDSHMNSVWESEASFSAEGTSPSRDEDIPLPPGIPNRVLARIPAHVMLNVLHLQRSFRRRCLAKKNSQAREASLPSGDGAHEGSTVAPAFTIGPERLTLYSINQVCEKFDREKSGKLDTFELYAAIGDLWGQLPTSAQVTAMIEYVGAHETNCLTFDQFIEVLSTDWSKVTRDGFDDFEIVFSKESLGFDIWFDEQAEHIEVNSVFDPNIKDRLAAGDIITTVNGAPLGLVNHPKLLQEKVRNLKRPLRIAFLRPLNKAVAGLDETEEKKSEESSVEAHVGEKTGNLNNGIAMEPSLDAPAAVARSTTQIKLVFSSFDPKDSGELDTFDLGHAVQAVQGQLPSTPQIMAMIETLGVFEAGKVTFQQFLDVLATDWSSITTVDSIEDAYEVSVEKDELGFDVSFDELNGRLNVEEVVDSELRSQVAVKDVLLAINGVPLGFISDLHAVREKIKVARRPVRITFYRRDALDKINNEKPNQTQDEPELHGPQSASMTTNEAAAQPTVTTLEVPQPAIETTNTAAVRSTSTVTSLNLSEIEAIFKRFDWDESGKLDSFELSRAVEVAWGRAPTMTQVLAMIDGVSGDFSLSLQQFVNVLKTDWSTLSEPEENDIAFDVMFSKDTLGFEVAFDETSGEIYVDSITDSDLIGRLDVGDTVLAVDNVPLGAVSDQNVLAERVKSVKRPFQISFYKN